MNTNTFKIIWKLKNGPITTEFTSFPYAFRTMFAIVKRGVETGKKYDDLTKGMKIISPLKDAHGDYRTYSYIQAVKMATDQGLLTVDGVINSKEFKNRH